ncbi:MAG TPA: hypothetical protein VK705_04510 [Ferruginibacter sp.]|jgi:hypothetical protein|nr:hypothetical protein [Ferruginibacter sp.]
MTFEAPLFIPSGKIKKDIGTLIIYASQGIVLLMCVLGLIFNFPKEVEDVSFYFLISFLSIMLITQISNFFRQGPLNGEIAGILKIDETKICYSDRIVSLRDVDDINFNLISLEADFGDYYNRFVSDATLYTPMISQGVENTIEIKTIAGEDILLHYRLNDKYHIQQLMPLVRILAILGKMPIIRAVSLLKLNYKEVQELKAEMGGNETGAQ